MRSLVLLSAAALVGCVDLKPAPAPPVRWMSLAAASAGAADAPSTAPAAEGIELGAVRAAGGVGELHVRRLSEVEVERVELVRWIERPEVVVERMLEHELYRRRGFARSGPRRVDVEVLAFEERLVPARRAVVVLEVLATSDGAVLVDRRIEGSEPIDGEDPASMARALEDALAAAVNELADLLADR